MKTISGKDVSRIGIGSYGIGGRGHRDIELTEKRDDETYVSALVYTLNKGINFTEIALGYGHGNSIKIFKQALDKSSVKREDIFFTHSFYPRDLQSIETITEDVESFHKIMDTDYADSTLITQGLVLKFGEDEVYPILKDLLQAGKTRFVSLSNASPEFIKAFKNEFGDKFYAHEGHLSFEVRVLQDKGVFNICDELGVKNIIWRPLRRAKTMEENWPLLVELSEKYGKTQNQIVLNWICNLGYSPMVFSTSKKHIDENYSATDFIMSDDDYKRINDFRPDNFNPQVAWDTEQADDDIVAAVNGF
ncbi:MAG TPA: aldo/keto reductase [Candidatus Levybacteria bacterium]|nr:aldo/keto reductase [Candidatus Levybacteria bacterium]